ncbi:MAG: vraS [Bacteroidetes bacterium]|nr:vraS [Bacteroidota bacterium]
MKITRNGLLLLLFLLVTGTLYSQFTQPGFRKIGKNEGLTGALVNSMVQDSRNLYWIGTLNGLQLFDGKTFKKYHLPLSQNGIAGSNSVSFLLPGNDSILWVAHYQGIAKFNLYSRTFEYIPVPKETPEQTLAFSSLFKDGSGIIWATSRELGLIRYIPGKNSFVRVGDKNFHLLKKVKALAAGNNRLLVFHKGGCGVFDAAKDRMLETNELPGNLFWLNASCLKGAVNDLYDDGEHVYALVWNDEKLNYDLMRLNKKSGDCRKWDIRSYAGRRFFKDSDNNIWVYGDGLDVIPAGSDEIVPIKENLKEGKAIDFSVCVRMFEDGEHNVWLCTNAGLFVFDIKERGFRIRNESDGTGYVKHIYNCINECADGMVWTGTFGQGLFILDKDLKLVKVIDLEKKIKDHYFNMLWCIAETKDRKEVWMGCQQGRLIRFDRATSEFSFYNDPAFGEKTVMCITENNDGDLFFGTIGGAVVKKEKGSPSFRRVYDSKQLEARTAAGAVTSIFCDGNELLIATNYDGIIRVNLKNEKTVHYKMSISDPGALKSNNIFGLLPDPGKGYFAGTSNGLGYFDYGKNKFSFYTFYDGLPFSNVYDLVNAGDNTMIAITSDGLYRINWELKSFERIDKNANLYKGFNGICLRRNGKEVLLADDEYLYSLPVSRSEKKTMPASCIYTVSSFDKSFFLKENQEELLHFDKDHNTINIEFGSSTFKYYNSIDYYYMLEGIDQEWLPAGSNRVVTYNNLKGGDYTFRLKCIFQENKSSIQELKMGFSVAKPFFQTAWFYLLLALFVCTLFYLLYRIRVNKLLAIEKIRFDLSRDLHDDMGSTLSTINILSVMAENKIEQEAPLSREYLKRINRISQEMMQSMDDIIWSINPVNDTMAKVVVRMREFAAGILEPLNISLAFEVDDAVPAIGTKMRWRRDFFLVFKEAINNAAKYSECKNVTIRISVSSRSLSLCITDDGAGFNPQETRGGNGLTNMKKRAEDAGGLLKVESEPGKGTRVSLLIPLKKL